jgi:hypothetical protein
MPLRSGAEYQAILPIGMIPAADAAAEMAADLEQGGDGSNAPVGPDGNLPAPGNEASDPLVLVPDVSPGQQAAPEFNASAGAMSSHPAIALRPVALPRDSIKLSKFKGDTDSHALDGFLFQLDMYFDAQPSAYDPEYNPNALRMRLLVIVGCLPAGSVAAIWFQSLYKRHEFTSYEVFVDLFTRQFQHSASDLVGLQNKWEDARQLRNQSVKTYYAYLLQQQAAHAAIAWKYRPSEATLLTKFCATLRPDLRRFLQEKRIDHPDYCISQLVQVASVRESASRAVVPELNAFHGGQRERGTPGADKKWCFFCKSANHNDTDCRKIAAKKAKGEWKDRPARR